FSLSTSRPVIHQAARGHRIAWPCSSRRRATSTMLSLWHRRTTSALNSAVNLRRGLRCFFDDAMDHSRRILAPFGVSVKWGEAQLAALGTARLARLRQKALLAGATGLHRGGAEVTEATRQEGARPHRRRASAHRRHHLHPTLRLRASTQRALPFALPRRGVHRAERRQPRVL